MKISKEIIEFNNISEATTQNDFIMDAIKSFYKETRKPIRQRTIAKLTGTPLNPLSAYLSKLILHGKIKQTGRGLYVPIDATELP